MVEQVKVLITLVDDSVVVMSFITNDYHGYTKEPTDNNINTEILRSNFGTVKSWKRIQDSEIIPDRTFRNAWRHINNTLQVDMPHAREIHKEKLRIARAEKFIELDAEYLRADEVGDITKKNEIKAKKQILRDITVDPRIDAAQTPEELKNVWFDGV